MADVSPAFQRLAQSSRRDLEKVHRAGATPDTSALVGFEFCGYNHPVVMGLLGVRKFIKGFFDARGHSFGFNTPVSQNGIEAAWEARPDEENPKRYAFYSVEADHSGDRHPNAIFLDYSRGDDGLPANLIRDYVVRVEEDSDDLLLGKAYLALGPARIPVGFFILERRQRFEPDPELEKHVRDPS
jgi:hypothetical protein